MTITTNLAPKYREREFSRRPATSRLEAALTLAAGAGISIYGLLRRDWFGAAFAGVGAYLAYAGAAELRKPYQGRVRVGFTIAKEPREVYEFVRDPRNWDIGLRGVKFEHDAQHGLSLRFDDGEQYVLSSQLEITDEKPGEHIAWASSGQMMEHRGVIRFKKAPGDRGTELSIAFEYKSPAGPLSRTLASFAGFDPEQLAREALRKMKQLMEAGEIPTTEGQPVGSRGVKGAAKRVVFRERPAVDLQSRLAGD